MLPLQVKIKSWIDGKKDVDYNGMTARFSSYLPEDADQAAKTPALFSDPIDCCSASASKVSFSSFSFPTPVLVNSFTPLLPSSSYPDQLLSVYGVLVTSQLKLHLHSPQVPLPP